MSQSAGSDNSFVILEERDIIDFNDSTLLPLSPENIARVQLWLNPTDYSAGSSENCKHQAARSPGTGCWIQETREYQQWRHSSECDVLWVKGIPGSGKSVVAAYLASSLQEEEVPVLTFFFRQTISTNKTPHQLIRDWLSQLLDASPPLQEALMKIIDDDRTLESVAHAELWDALISTLSRIPRAFCIIDALDEMDFGNEAFILKLLDLGQLTHSAKIIMTSRPLPYIEKTIPRSAIQIYLHPQYVDKDILTYFNNILSVSNISRPTQHYIRSVLCRKSNGSFLYARLMMKDILESEDCSELGIKQILRKLPNNLGAAYIRLLSEHSTRSGTPQELQLFILKFITHSSRPLCLLEISSIADFALKTKDICFLDPPSEPKIISKAAIRSGCGPLIEISKDEVVAIIHHSLAEFLTDPERSISDFPHVNRVTTHLQLAVLCIKYLLASVSPEIRWDGGGNRPPTNIQMNSQMTHHFLDYSTNHWWYHVFEFGQADRDLFLLLDQLLQLNSKTHSLCLKPISDGNTQTSLLHFAASIGLAQYARHIIECDLNPDLNCRDSKSRSPLHCAAANGHVGVVEILLEHGASRNPDDYEGLTPLHLAVTNNHSQVVRKLLASGVDPMTPKTRERPGRRCGNSLRTTGQTAVQYASRSGNADVILEMLPYLRQPALSPALCWASEFGQSRVVLAILHNSEVDVNQMVDGNTPIQFAAHARDLISMKALLDKGANAQTHCNVIGEDAWLWKLYLARGDEFPFRDTPLHSFSHGEEKGNMNTSTSETIHGLEMLLNAGCNVNEHDFTGQTPLHYFLRGAKYGGHKCSLEVISWLLEHGADPLLLTKDEQSAIQLALGHSKDVLALLISKGADVNAISPSGGRSPIFAAVLKNDERAMRTLIKYGADFNLKDSKGNTLLHCVFAEAPDSLSTIKLLFDNGVNLSMKNYEGLTPLEVLDFRRLTTDLLEVFIEKSIDFDSRARQGQTFLLKALQCDCKIDVLEMLVDARVDVSAHDYNGRNALHYCCEKAASKDTVEKIRILCRAGANPQTRDFSGNTLFHAVAGYHTYQGAQVDLLDLLLEYRISPRSRNNQGQTPLYTLVEQGNFTDNTELLDFFLGPKCTLDINNSDHRGIRPIHLAANFTEDHFKYLLSKGADPLPVTQERLSVLHICARARQSNTVGLVVEKLIQLDSSHLIDHIDSDGRTALHYAIMSGRVESVAILLGSGKANPNLKDKHSLNTLDFCTLFAEENSHWRTSSLGDCNRQYVTKSCVTLDQFRRPPTHEPKYERGFKRIIEAERETVGIRQIVRQLIIHGVDTSFMSSHKLRWDDRHPSPFKRALLLDCGVLVEELLDVPISPVSEEEEEESDTDDGDDAEDGATWLWRMTLRFRNLENHVLMRLRSLPVLFDNAIRIGEPNLELFQFLLLEENYKGIEELHRRGADLLVPAADGQSCVSILVKWGYASLLEKVGDLVGLSEGTWSKKTKEAGVKGGRAINLVSVACARELPNLGVIKILVEKFHMNVNDEIPGTGQVALHILAKSKHWWNIQAVVYLLNQRAKADIRDGKGNTPLLIALTGQYGCAVVKELLLHGANPNTLDSQGESCLTKAKKHPEIISQLVKHGANALASKKPFLLSCIEALDLQTIGLLIESGVNLNTEPILESEPKIEPRMDENRQKHKASRWRWRAWQESLQYAKYPVHFAASPQFNNEKSKEQMISIIEALLNGGADPLLRASKTGDSILHAICEEKGIIEPFFDLPALELEARDSKGRTLLLAACYTLPDYFCNQDRSWLDAQKSIAQLLFAKGADITAADDEGRNIFHYLLTSSRTYSWMHSSHPKDFEFFLSIASSPTSAKYSSLALHKQADSKGVTPLHLALSSDQLWAVEPLLASGADPNQTDRQGNTPLHFLASLLPPSPHPADALVSKTRSLLLFTHFLDLGLSINALNSLGETPVFNLFRSKAMNMERILFFVSQGADLTVVNGKREGLLHLCALKGGGEEKECEEGDVWRYLIGQGLDPMMEDGESMTPGDWRRAVGKG